MSLKLKPQQIKMDSHWSFLKLISLVHLSGFKKGDKQDKETIKINFFYFKCKWEMDFGKRRVVKIVLES